MFTQINWENTHFLHLDKPLLIGLVTLSAVGLVVLYSACGQDIDAISRQSMRILVGFCVMFFLAQVHIQHIARWSPWLYFIGIVSLIAVLVVGKTVNGSQRWLDLGIFRFQPSEVMKLVVPMMVTWYLADKPLPPSYRRLFVATVIVFIPVLLIAEQPDLGTSLLIAFSGVFVMFLAGISWKLMASLVLISMAIVSFFVLSVIYAPTFALHAMHPYQLDRILTFIHPENDPLGAGYHIIQSKIAIGSGGLYGKGWLNGTQSHLEFLPERSTDFIFAVYSEEFGLLGVMLLLSIYIFILTRGIYIAVHAQGMFARLLAGSLTLTFFVYIFVNMSMVTGLLPVVGLPLPLVSYGGTSLVTLMAGFGLIMAIHTHRRLLSGY